MIKIPVWTTDVEALAALVGSLEYMNAELWRQIGYRDEMNNRLMKNYRSVCRQVDKLKAKNNIFNRKDPGKAKPQC